MLTDLSIENLGVIVSARIELSPGLTVLTGETGAGKTMVVTGLRLLSGGRADASRVRSGAKKAVVEGHFDVSEVGEATRQEVAESVAATGGETDENGEYLAARSVNATGRSRAYVGGRAASAAALATVTAPLLTIHGQNDQLRLLGPGQQRAALDRFDPAIGPLLARYREDYRTWRTASTELENRTTKRRELAQEADRLAFAIKEIDTVDPVAGEEEDVLTAIRRLQDVDELRAAATSALVRIDGPEELGGMSEEEPASTLVAQAAEALAATRDDALTALGVELRDIASRLSGVSAELGAYVADLPVDPEELDTLLQRQQSLKSLTRKYAADIAGVLAWRAKAARKLSRLDVSTEALEELSRHVAAAKEAMVASAGELSAARRSAAVTLSQAVTEELRGLSMPQARIDVAVEPRDFGPDGCDDVELRLAPNATSESRPIATAASGGELSRVMLALEVILSAGNTGTTMVFDEVDAGVGGRAAVEIGRRLARLATDNQVIVVTHLPQVAAYADTHLHVAKNVGADAVTSGVVELTDEERVEELSRMLAGLDDTETGRAHAAELFEKARGEVRGWRM
ncbi:DNA repair protein RecN [Corynebacterium uterequi]|uniref:DNA repair protein RecN n=1 Tax=Corynebacterium uterequi TaxID=1072256 RepID=A0A0G3HE65_9CORY|nr:DNA repair protein RecN [Corynebacterium uterequi]AKK11035.1 DNA replication and repair protein RecN [Corynebacterium uterequi]